VALAKAHVDPVELRRFAKDLNRFNAELDELLGSMRGRLQTLEQSWQDQEQRKFAEEFERTMKPLSRFLNTSADHVAFLMKKVRHIEDYLQQG
jgi:uncharacterized protein YukE